MMITEWHPFLYDHIKWNLLHLDVMSSGSHYKIPVSEEESIRK